MDAFAAAAQEHASLLHERDSLSYAPSSLTSSRSRLASLQSDASKLTKELTRLHSAASKERDEWRAVAESKWKRFTLGVKYVGSKEKMEERVGKEEREWVEAFEREKDAKNRLDGVRAEIQREEEEIRRLESLVARHDSATSSLTALHQRLFTGPTPSHPSEDAAESSYTSSLAAHTAAHNILQQHTTVVASLKRADDSMKQATKSIVGAMDASDMDMFGVGGRLADGMEGSKLSEAKMAFMQTQMHWTHAQRTDAGIPDLPAVEIAQQNYMTDVMFDNLYSDYKMHQKIKSSADQLHSAHRFVQHHLSGAQQRAAQAREEEQRRRRTLEEDGRRLWDTRVGIMRAAAGGAGANAEGPPAYEA